MDNEETIEVVDYYLDLLKDGTPSDLKIISTPISIMIVDGDVRPDRYNITKDVIGEELYSKLLAYKTN